MIERNLLLLQRQQLIRRHFEREPKIKDADPFYRDKSIEEARKLLSDESRANLLAAGENRPCPMLDCYNRCTIYPSRPNNCVAMQAGDGQCQWARSRLGLPPLEPTSSGIPKA